ncbi:MAG: tRNA pseudouridine(55) synthase TruB [Patescibacteria group bacterium]
MTNDTRQNELLLINKPSGPTSHDIVDRVRKQTGIKRVGHAGTLDPFATGLLIILVGREQTKRQSEFLTMDKTYEAVIKIGGTSTTDDCTGEITSNPPESPITPTLIQKTLQSFIGTFDQMPPNFSAKKIKGKKAYELAREGIQPDLKPKQITIYSIEFISYSWPLLTIRCSVSSGTYIRALARDIGKALGGGAYCEKLMRTSIGPYNLSDASLLDELNSL